MKEKININKLIEKSQKYRLDLFDMCASKKRGHVQSSFSLVELIISLYDFALKHDPKNPLSEDRDRLIVSEGHAAIVQYPALVDHNYFPKEELSKFTLTNGLLRQYPDNSIPGIECATGSLGHGLGIGAGLALHEKKRGKNYNIFVIIGDGEYWEGSISEAAQFSAHNSLNNLIAILNHNRLSILGEIEKLLRQEPLEEKWKSYGWFVQRINGHSYNEIIDSFRKIFYKPKIFH